MRYARLGQSGVRVGILGLGCMMFGWRTPQAEADRIVGLGLDAGVNLFDTSVSYGRGESETILGRALGAYGAHDALVATKCGLPAEERPGVNGIGASRRNIVRQCELSLKRLKVDCIDLLQLHRAFDDTPIEETLAAFDQLIQAGKVRYCGTSNFPAWRLVEGLWAADVRRLIAPVSEQFRYNAFDRSAEAELLPVLSRYGLGGIVYSPLAEGLLTGRYRSGTPLEVGSRFQQSRDRDRYAAMLEPSLDRGLAVVAAEAHRLGLSMAAVATAWVAGRAGVSCVLVGPSRAEQLCDLLGAADLDLDADACAAIEAVCPPRASLTPRLA